MSEIGHDGLAWNNRNYKNLIINVALTGAVPQKKDFPNLPVTPQEIAHDVHQCFEMGAQVFHLHMRDQNGAPSQEIELFQETIIEIRSQTPEAIICVTTSSRASQNSEERYSALKLTGELKPDLASLSLGSFNFPSTVSKNPPYEIFDLARFMFDSGIKPEIEVFEPGMLTHARTLLKSNVLIRPLIVNILLGNRGTSEVTAQAISPFLSQLSGDSEWALAGIGRFQNKAIMLGVALGGNVRVGMEDDPVGNEYGEWSNTRAVQVALDAAKVAGRKLASIEETRIRFGLPPK